MGKTMSDVIPAWVNGVLQPVEKLAVHQRALRHRAVSVFVVAQGRLLVQRRAMGKYHTPGLWANTCCTHPHWGEDDMACAQRRLQQELGITGLALQPRGTVEYSADVGNGLHEHEVVALFLGQASPDVPLAPNPNEVMQTRWVHMSELMAELSETPDIYTPWMRIYMAEHAERIFGKNGAADDRGGNL